MLSIFLFIASKGFGGAEKALIQTARQLLIEGHEVHVPVVKDCNWTDRLDERCHVYKLRSSSSRYNILLYLELLVLIFRIRPHITHTHGAKATEIFHRLRHLNSSVFIATKHNSRRGKIFDKIQNVIAVSGKVAETIQGKSEIIYNGTEYSPPKTVGNKAPTFEICAFGRLDKIKQYDLLIEAVKILNSPSVRLRIYGEGDERLHLHRLVASNKSKSLISLEKHAENVPDLMHASNLVVICSKSEGFSLVMIEAIFYSPILISTPVGSAVEVLPKQYIFDIEEMAKKIKDIIENYALYEEQFEIFSSSIRAKLEISCVTKQLIRYYYSKLN